MKDFLRIIIDKIFVGCDNGMLCEFINRGIVMFARLAEVFGAHAIRVFIILNE